MNAILQYLEDEEKKLAAAIKEFFAGLRAHPAVTPADFSPAPLAGEAAPVAPPAEAPAAAPEAQPPGGNTTDPVAPGFIPPAAAEPVLPASPAAPTVDTSADTLDFNAVADIPIDLTGPKTIVNCPAHVVVKAEQASGQSGAHNSYTITVNGAATLMPNVENEYISSNYGLDVQGPTVNVSVDSPGLQMEIQAA